MMHVAMTARTPKWFGTTPPDLSVIARAKSVNAGPSGSDYIYTYLRTFYRDTSRATGWNNLVFPAVGMPHALWERQGPRADHGGHARSRGQGRRAQDLGKGHDGVRCSRFCKREDRAGGELPRHATFEAKFKAANPAQVTTTTTWPT